MTRATRLLAPLILVLAVGPRPALCQPGGATLILGDASGSMRGYAQASPATLSALFYVLARNNEADAQLRLLRGAEIAPLPKNSLRHFSAPSSYGGNTDISEALKYIRGRDGISYLVTDGMQSEGMYLAVKGQLKEMAREGWGIWLLSTSMQFNGVYDPEQEVDLEYRRQDIERCVQAEHPDAKVEIPKGGRRTYTYKGPKPLLLFVFARDADEGRRRVGLIDNDLRADRQFSPSVVELAPLRYRGVVLGEVSKADLADYIEIEGQGSDSLTINSDPADQKPVKEVYAPVLWTAEQSPLPQAYVETAHFEPGEVSWLDTEPETVGLLASQSGDRVVDNIKFRFASEMSTFRWLLCKLPFTTCRDEKAGALDLALWTTFDKAGGAWWDGLNSDNSWECPHKVYKLTELTGEVAAEAAQRHQAAHPPKKVSFRLVVRPL